MVLSTEAVPRPAHRYRLPALLQDIRLLDLLELSGTTQEAARLACLSQPTVSRRTRLLTNDFALEVNRRRREGCCYGTSPVMQLLRLGCRAHRLASGVARLGTDVLLQPLMEDCHWLLPSPARFRSVASWLELVRQGVIDGALVSGLEFPGDAPPQAEDLELLPLGELPFGLVMAPGPTLPARPQPTVLVPNRAVAQGLHRALQQRGLPLKTAGNTCHTPAQWRQRLECSDWAMAFPQLEPDHWWEGLRRLPLPTPLHIPLWLVLPAGWRQQGVLAHTVDQLCTHPGLTAREGA
ncbi:hypothetical protein [Vulcanococcus limneticus]|uniref:hypothetical protein n=1 Tax=Vulcanococcus limneticus TaxID=2170428 RepID=UPI00398BE09A